MLRAGGVIAYPAETVYGLGCDPRNRDACERIMRLKRRESSRTMLLLAASEEMVACATGGLDGISAELARLFWPGPLTIVLRPLRHLPEHLFGPSGGVAFRVTSHPVAEALIREFGRPLISTSANLSGEPPVSSADAATRIFGDGVDLVVPCDGPLGGVPSTIVDVTSGSAALIREGAIPFTEIRKVVHR